MLGEECKKPIIGILAQEISSQMKDTIEKEEKKADSYIAASYVKAVQSSGARVVPIFLNQSEEYYSKCLQSINGLLLPGGNTWFYKEDDKTPKDYGYPQAAEILYNKVKEMNNILSKNGMLFPVLGICLGFEILLFLDAGKREYREVCKVIKSALPINFKAKFNNAGLEDCPVDLFREPVSYFSHQFYTTEETMTNNTHLNEKWEVVATTNEEERRIEYVSIIKSKKYPIIGLQFHPEKNAYEWKDGFNIPHDENSIKASRYFFDWLVRQARKNNNHFDDSEEEFQSLINNYSLKFTPKKSSFDEIYFFP